MTNQEREIINSALRFLEAFENVFHYDWEHTKHALTDLSLIRSEETFCEPEVEDPENNWSARGLLLDCYKDFKSIIQVKTVDLKDQGKVT